MEATPMHFIPRADDSEIVREALRQACALWAGRQRDGALQSLRRAIESAGDEGNDKRMLELSKALADLVQPAPRPPRKAPAVPPPLPLRAGAPRRLPPPVPRSLPKSETSPIPPIRAP
jgi:hypothetical protein